MSVNRVHVVVALIRREDKLLIALRPDHLHQGGLWEFPGGKINQGEQPGSALGREIKEELGITITSCCPLFEISHDYPDKSVLLDIWEVTTFAGEPVGNEGQQIAWVSLDELGMYHFPEANQPILDYLQRV